MVTSGSARRTSMFYQPPPPSSPPGPFSVLAPKARARAELVEVLHAVVATSQRGDFPGRKQRMQGMIQEKSVA